MHLYSDFVFLIFFFFFDKCLKIPMGSSEAVNRKEQTMQWPKEQTTIYKILYIKRKIEQDDFLKTYC